ncbi:hypothetical protein [Prosthecobacter sp.]|uniref:hypothetical protein n=1 Tax=Prosthecobacter sp. TaxID=1965333 RepID=UPI0037838537
MSTASAGTPSEPPQSTGQQPGALAILTATAVGGVLASRLGKGPLVLAAGMAAFALLKQKKSAAQPGMALPLPPPAAPFEDPTQSQVEQWLSQQISRDEQAPAIDFSTVIDPAPAEDDDYKPQPFLLDVDDSDVSPAPPASDDSFAQLADPVEWHMPVAAHHLKEESAPPAPYQSAAIDAAPLFIDATPLPGHPAGPDIEPAPPPAFFAPEPFYSAPELASSAPGPADHAPAAAYSAAPSVESPPPPVYSAPPPVFYAPSPAYSPSRSDDSTWALGVEPLPSLTVAAPFSAPAGSMFFAAPLQQEAVEPQPAIPLPSLVFEGAAFPDEINVVPAIEPVVHLTPAAGEAFFANTAFHPPVAIQTMEPAVVENTDPVPAPEIVVHLAPRGEGEASFDPPLAAAPQNPWEVELGPGPASNTVPFHPPQIHPVVEAEIILRPRAPTQNTVTTKTKPGPHAPISKDFAESFDSPPATAAAPEEAMVPSLPETPAEAKTRSSWRSWWRGD